ncbi:MAG: glycerol 3-phosphate dehydrogenase [Bacteroidota bacterium]
MRQDTKSMQVGVIGTGSFSLAVITLLSNNVDVLIYSRKPEVVTQINTTHQIATIPLATNVTATSDRVAFTKACTLIFPIISSDSFRAAMQSFAPYLRPYHILIHGTKGFDIHGDDPQNRVHTMSQIIQQETNVLRIGCLSGPNLAVEIIEGLPTATVIGSEFQEVIEAGQAVLSSPNFHVFGTQDLRGAEVAGAFKNVIAIGSGMLRGMGLGKNMQAVYLNQGLKEMIRFGKAIGTQEQVFFEVAGVGDLIATTTSKKSRNY